MNRHILRGKYREVRGGVRREWGRLTHNDLTKMEGELDRMVGLLQKRYGYTQERAAKELERFVEQYGERTRAALSEPLEQLREHPGRTISMFWIVVAIVSGVFVLMRLRSQANSRQYVASQPSSGGAEQRGSDRTSPSGTE